MLVVTFGRDDLVPLHVPETAASHLCNWSRIFTPTFAKQTCKTLAHGVSPPGPESCVPVHVTGDPHDEEAWGFRARPAANALWKEPEVLYTVGDRVRCDEVRAALDTPSEACWGRFTSDGSERARPATVSVMLS